MFRSDSNSRASIQLEALGDYPADRTNATATIHRRSRGHYRSSGQSIVEFALALPLLLLFLLSILYFGRAFYVKQTITMAAQEGTRLAARICGLSNNTTRDYIRGFSIDGQSINVASPIYACLSQGRLLDGPGGTSGNLPAGSRIEILPFDDLSIDLAPGTVGVRIQYPFKFLSSPSFGTVYVWSGPDGGAIPFSNTVITEQAVAAQEVF